MSLKPAPTHAYRRLFKRLDGVLAEAHRRGKLSLVANLSELRHLLEPRRLSPSELADAKKALHIVAFKSQQFLRDLQPDERLPFDKSVADFVRRFGHPPANYEVQNRSRAWFNMERKTPVRVKNKCVVVSGAMEVLLNALTSRRDAIGFTHMPGHAITTFRLNGVPHVVHAFGAQPLSEFKADLVAASRNPAHPLRALAENGRLHDIGPVADYLDRYMTFAEGRAGRLLRRESAWNNRAFAHAESGDLVEAEKFAREALRMRPRSDHTLALMSRIYYHQQRFDASRHAAERAVELNPLNPDAHYRLGLALRAQKKYGPAIRAFDASLSIRPGSVDTRKQQNEAWNRWSRESGLFKGLAVDAARGWHAFKRRWSPVFQRA